VVMSKIMLHTGNHVAEITPNDVVDYHRAAARCAMIHRWLADKCRCAWLGQRVAGLRMLTLLQPGQPVTLH